jgi:hypothetical protein
MVFKCVKVNQDLQQMLHLSIVVLEKIWGVVAELFLAIVTEPDLGKSRHHGLDDAW